MSRLLRRLGTWRRRSLRSLAKGAGQIWQVVHLLEGMEADLSKEAAEDEATNEEMKRLSIPKVRPSSG